MDRNEGQAGEVIAGRTLRRRLGPDAWVNAAFEELQHTSTGALSLPKLSASLGVTKGSFYAHFSTREAFLDHVARAFADQFVASTPHFVADPDIAPERKAQRLLEHDFGSGNSLHKIFSQLQRWDAPHQAVVAIHEARTHHIALYTGILVELGIDRSEAEQLAAATHTTYTGYWTLRSASATQEVAGLNPTTYQRLLTTLLVPGRPETTDALDQT